MDALALTAHYGRRMSDGTFPETWTTRELPILRAAMRRLEDGDPFPDLEAIRQQVGLELGQMRLAVDALSGAQPPYFKVKLYNTGPRVAHGHVTSISERARRELGTWPTSANVVDELVQAMERAAVVEPEQRSRFLVIAAGLRGFARDVAVGVVATKLNGI